MPTYKVKDKKFSEMSDEEFFSVLTARIAEKAGISEDEVEKMDISEIEKKLGIKTTDPFFPMGSPEGYASSKRYRVLNENDYKRRKEVVEKFMEE